MKKICSLFLSLAVLLSLTTLPASAAAELTFPETAVRRLSADYLVTSDGVMWRWKGEGASLEKPVKVRENVAAVANNGSTVAWLDTQGALWGEGTNHYNQLGVTHNRDQYGTERPLEAPVKLLENVQDFYVGREFMLALCRDGSVWGWGTSEMGQLGPNWNYQINSGRPVKVLDGAVQLATSEVTAMALKKDGTVWTWGSNMSGLLGRGALPGMEQARPEGNHDKNPTKIMDDVAWINIGGDTAGAVKRDGGLYTWGDGQWGKLGNGQPWMQVEIGGSNSFPEKVMDGVARVQMAIFALKQDGSVWGAGPNTYDRLGLGNWNGDNWTWNGDFGKIMDDVVDVWAGKALTSDGTLWAWGDNREGQLGDVEKYGEVIHTPVAILDFGVENPAAESFVSDWAKDGVAEAKALGLLTVWTSGSYQSPISRVAFTDLVVNLTEKTLGHELPWLLSLSLFKDTRDENVIKAYEAGIINGPGDGTFLPENLITREQVACILCRAVEYIAKETGKNPLVSGSLDGYADASQVSSWAAKDVGALAASGVMQGSGGSLSPKNNISVEESILLALRVYHLLNG